MSDKQAEESILELNIRAQILSRTGLSEDYKNSRERYKLDSEGLKNLTLNDELKLNDKKSTEDLSR